MDWSGGFLQFRITTGAIEENFLELTRALKEAQPSPGSIIVLPEMFLTGFAYKQLTSLQDKQFLFVQYLQKNAQENKIWLLGSLAEPYQPSGGFYNSLFLFGGIQPCSVYRKHFLFPGEEECFLPDTCVPQKFTVQDLNIGGLVCYDLRFPFLSRDLAQQGADCLICSAQWPKERISHWKSLLVSRAIENQCYVIGCNGLGDNNEVELGGSSIVIDPMGTVILEAGTKALLACTNIQSDLIEKARTAYSSYAALPPVRAAEKKWIDEKSVVEEIEKLARRGVKVVCLLVDKSERSVHLHEKIEHLRKDADLLFVATPSTQYEETLSYGAAVDSIFTWTSGPVPLKGMLEKVCTVITQT